MRASTIAAAALLVAAAFGLPACTYNAPGGGSYAQPSAGGGTVVGGAKLDTSSTGSNAAGGAGRRGRRGRLPVTRPG